MILARFPFKVVRIFLLHAEIWLPRQLKGKSLEYCQKLLVSQNKLVQMTLAGPSFKNAQNNLIG